MRRILLRRKDGNHMYALVDNEDFNRVNKYNWFAHKSRYTFYVMRNTPIIYPNGGEGWTCQSLHRFILNLPPGRFPEVDHIDWNGLNNQKSNLRCVTAYENVHHRRRMKYW